MDSILRNKSLRAFAVLVFSVSLIGCGDNASGLRGAATYNGTPIAKGSISFMPVDGVGTPFGAKIIDGQYVAEKTFPGKFTATVSAERDVVVPKTREEAAAMEKSNQGKATSGSYVAEDASGNSQIVDVTGGGQTLDFTITGPPGP